MSDDVKTGRDVDHLIAEDASELYEEAPCGYASILPDGLIVRANATLARWVGNEPSELLAGRRFAELLTPGGRIFYETHFAPLLRMQGFVREIALEIVSRDQRRIPVLMTARMKTDAAGEPLLARMTLFDATERRHYERELLAAQRRAEEATKAKTDLLNMISHDIRAPLNAILTAAALIEKTGAASAQAKYVRVLRSSGRHIMTLVEHLLDVGRLEAGRATPVERHFDLRRLAEDVGAGMRLPAEDKGLEMRVTVDTRMPALVVGDADRIEQVLTNLLSNAVKFTERGFVSLTMVVRELTPDAVTFEATIADTGIGIPADRLSHIFEEFTQGSETTARRYGGVGLGLTISRSILALYGSTLNVSSVAGEGSTFAFTLRLALPANHASGALKSAIES